MAVILRRGLSGDKKRPGWIWFDYFLCIFLTIFREMRCSKFFVLFVFFVPCDSLMTSRPVNPLVLLRFPPPYLSSFRALGSGDKYCRGRQSTCFQYGICPGVQCYSNARNRITWSCLALDPKSKVGSRNRRVRLRCGIPYPIQSSGPLRILTQPFRN